MALLPYANRVTTQRGGGRDRGEPAIVATAAIAVTGAMARRRARTRRRPSATTRRRSPTSSRSDRRLIEPVGWGWRMKLLLRSDVSGVGKRGDIVDVADGYARNYLVPKGFAIKASPGVEQQAEQMRRSRAVKDAHDRGAPRRSPRSSCRR